jgi:pfkB family carbohydrate kinase
MALPSSAAFVPPLTRTRFLSVFLGVGSLHTCHVTRSEASSRRRTELRSCGQADREVDPLLLTPLGAPKVLCIGEALLDVAGGIARPGGAPANLAAALAGLGCASAFIGAVGDDSGGFELKRVLAERLVNVEAMQMLKGKATRRVVVDVDAVTGERDFVAFSGGRNCDFADADGYVCIFASR